MINYDKWVLELLCNLKNNIQKSIYSKSEIDKLLKDLNIDVNNVITEEDIQKLKNIQIGTNNDGKFFTINSIKVQIKTVNNEEHVFINDKDISIGQSTNTNIAEMNDEEVKTFVDTIINN